jgi:hypothetical protein
MDEKLLNQMKLYQVDESDPANIQSPHSKQWFQCTTNQLKLQQVPADISSLHFTQSIKAAVNIHPKQSINNRLIKKTPDPHRTRTWIATLTIKYYPTASKWSERSPKLLNFSKRIERNGQKKKSPQLQSNERVPLKEDPMEAERKTPAHSVEHWLRLGQATTIYSSYRFILGKSASRRYQNFKCTVTRLASPCLSQLLPQRLTYRRSAHSGRGFCWSPALIIARPPRIELSTW